VAISFIKAKVTTSYMDRTLKLSDLDYRLLIGIGDLHGHFPALDVLLQSLHKQYDIFENIDNLDLKPGVNFVFTGDYIDRGNQGRRIIQTLMQLQENNFYNVNLLFGNHELLALACLDRARKAMEVDSDAKINHIYRSTSIHGANGGDVFVREFGETQDSAIKRYVSQMEKGAELGTWMRCLESAHVTEIGGKKILFVHGGIPREIADMPLVEYMERFDDHVFQETQLACGATEKYLGNPLVGEHSVFWDRSMPRMVEGELRGIAEKVGVDHIVIGHTPNRAGEIQNYFNLAFNVDIGMCPKYGANEPGAIVFKKDDVVAFYAEKGEQQLLV